MTKEELEKENAELEDKLKNLASVAEVRLANWQKYEKENAELKQACHKWFMRWREAKKDVLYFDSSLQKQIEATLKLQQENAELKDYRLTTLAKQQTDMSKYALNLEHKLSWYDDQLTKAKKIISECLPALKRGSWWKLHDKAEAFLNSEVNNALS